MTNTTPATLASAAPAGFRPVEMRFVEDEPETFISYQGPQRGHVETYWNEGRGITVALDQLGDNGREGVDLTPAQARTLAADLTAVLDQLAALDGPQVEHIARELHARGKRATMDQLGQACDYAGVSPVAVVAAYAALKAGQDDA